MKLSDPFKILSPNERRAPAQDQTEGKAYEMRALPLVYKIRETAESVWEEAKNDLKFFKDICKFFEAK